MSISTISFTGSCPHWIELPGLLCQALLTSTKTNEAEINAFPSFSLTVRGFDFLNRIKSLVEAEFPGVVSWADIVADFQRLCSCYRSQKFPPLIALYPRDGPISGIPSGCLLLLESITHFDICTCVLACQVDDPYGISILFWDVFLSLPCCFCLS